MQLIYCILCVIALLFPLYTTGAVGYSLHINVSLHTQQRIWIWLWKCQFEV